MPPGKAIRTFRNLPREAQRVWMIGWATFALLMALLFAKVESGPHFIYAPF